MNQWICKYCGHEVMAEEKPEFKWDDGHVCEFELIEENDDDSDGDWPPGAPVYR
jgi:hypothetical protein